MGTYLSNPPLGIGDLAEGFCLEDELQNELCLADALALGPLLLVFYRGDW